jgi:hypothetical protein
MSGDRAPALVSFHSDLIEYHVSDGSPVDPKSKKGYQERFIHSEIYKRFPHINSVIHSHSDSVLPYTMNGVPMKPTFHIAGFLGTFPFPAQFFEPDKTRNKRPYLRHRPPLYANGHTRPACQLPKIRCKFGIHILHSHLHNARPQCSPNVNSPTPLTSFIPQKTTSNPPFSHPPKPYQEIAKH